ncbi:hypothetical protein CHELA1G11_12822 [Hyphomicrobiales bacterium]|nr:hypothetical protein CHELA1G11_12822 [Hyphomicrobiales bacterium]CAH1677160.1 hypothetical protein CHELA41_24355 [Hyphomicrobiales bacterium]
MPEIACAVDYPVTPTLNALSGDLGREYELHP